MHRVPDKTQGKKFSLTDYTNKEIATYIINNDMFWIKSMFQTNELALFSDIYNNNSLHLATKCGHYEMVKYMLDQNTFDTDYKNIHGETALNIAVKEQHTNIINLFAEYKSKNLLASITELESANNQLNDEIIMIKRDLDTCTQTKKRLHDDNYKLEQTNKKFKSDIITYQDMLKNNK